MVVMEKQHYIDKALSLQTPIHIYRQGPILTDTNTYRIINMYPTTRLKKTHQNSLETSNKQEDSVTEATERCTQLVLSLPSLTASPKFIRLVLPSDPLCPVCGSITYGVAEELANIICSLVGQSPHQLKNTQYFVKHIQEIRLEPGEVITSYDVKTFFTSVPVDPSIQIVQQNYYRTLPYPKGPTCPSNR